jgi:hypothetical protein
MNKYSATIVAGFVAQALSGYANASTLSEVEDNHPLQSAQYLTINTASGISINGAIGQVNGDANSDLDFFEFYAREGDVVDLDIANGMGGEQSVDTVIAVYDEYGNLLRLNDDEVWGAGDSRIEKFNPPATGRYIVGVSNFPRFFTQNGEVMNAAFDNSGDYSLTISGISAATKQVNIDIKPGMKKEDAPLNPRSKGKIPVAILSEQGFSPMNIDTSRLYFGKTGTENSLHKCLPQGKDINRDGDLDLVCHFSTKDAKFDYGSLEGVVTGYTIDGTAFEGRAPLKVVPRNNK